MVKPDLKHKVLLVDDDYSVREVLKEFLDEAGYEVREAENGKTAQTLIALESFDVIVSDIRMPLVNGIELLHFVKRTKPTPFILMTGFSDISEAQEAYALGAKEFLNKPFNKNELLSAISKCIVPKDSEPEKPHSLDIHYCKVGIDAFLSGSMLQYDLYVRLSETKYIKIAAKGQAMDGERVEIYKAKGTTYLYMLKEDFSKYVGFSLNIMDAVAKTDLSRDKKLKLLEQTAEIILERAHIIGVDKQIFASAQNTLESTISIICEDKDLSHILQMLNTHTDFLYAHSIGVSLYSTMVAREVGWGTPSSLFKVSMGGLFHDIGKKELDRGLLEKPRKNYTVDEVREFESHPMRGRDILNQIRSVPSDVVFMAMYHHENMMGTGYPFKIRREKFHPLARLVGMVNEFCNLVLHNPNNPSPISAEAAVDKMLQYHFEEFDPSLLLALMKIFNIPVDPKYTHIFKKKGAA